eukprot:CAMPEP_0113480092 /NCGR_PEP_ID=MMETSP0014_2-20120614/21675_1 /TAXON_ID=2857 /ORGANISM="Nitzschia sp." /LENGTH=108 /DNA_ID=CAMNT_0000373467 /DNA_START=394 /DNA_END=720 /DNA_ORIENTATION=+ /assembly_acc=CAM_ASM_000159
MRTFRLLATAFLVVVLLLSDVHSVHAAEEGGGNPFGKLVGKVKDFFGSIKKSLANKKEKKAPETPVATEEPPVKTQEEEAVTEEEAAPEEEVQEESSGESTEGETQEL